MEQNAPISSAPTTPVSPVSPPPTPVETPTTPDPVARFRGLGTNFRAKLIGIDDVPDSRGDQMCQESILKLKAAVVASGRHKQKIIVNVSLEGIKIVDVMTGEVQHVHPVHRISFIARDTTDRRAFGYVYGAEEGRHQFYGVKTAKAAEALVVALRDLFQVVYDMKKKEIDEAKAAQDDENVETSQQVISSQSSMTQPPVQGPPAQSNENIMDLKQQLTNIQEGINNMDAIGPWSNEANTFQEAGGSEQNNDMFGLNLSDISSLSSDLSCSSNILIDYGFAGGRRRGSSKRSTSSQPIGTSNNTNHHGTSKTEAVDNTSLENSQFPDTDSTNHRNIQGASINGSQNDIHETSYSVTSDESVTVPAEGGSLEETDFKASEMASESESSLHDDVNTLTGSNSALSDITDARSKTPANQDIFIDPFCMSKLPEGVVCEGFGDDPFVPRDVDSSKESPNKSVWPTKNPADNNSTDNFESPSSDGFESESPNKSVWPSDNYDNSSSTDNFKSPSSHAFESDPFADDFRSNQFASDGFDVDPFVIPEHSSPAASSQEVDFTVDPFAIQFPSNADPFQNNESDDPFTNVEDIFGKPTEPIQIATEDDNDTFPTKDGDAVSDAEQRLNKSITSNDSAQSTHSIENEHTGSANERVGTENLSIAGPPPVIPPRRDIRSPTPNFSDSGDGEDDPLMPEYLPPMPEKPPPLPKRRPPPLQADTAPLPRQNSSYSEDLFSLGAPAAQPAPQPGAKLTNDQILYGFGGVPQHQQQQQMFAMVQQGMSYQPASSAPMPAFQAASYPQMGAPRMPAVGAFPSGPSPVIPPRPGAMRPPAPHTLPQGSNQNPFGDAFSGQAPMLTPASSNSNAAASSQEPQAPSDPFASLIPGMGAANSASANKKDMFKNYQMSKPPQPPPRTNPPPKGAEAMPIGTNADQSSFDSYFLQSVGGVPLPSEPNATANQFGVPSDNSNQPFGFPQNGVNGGTSLFG